MDVLGMLWLNPILCRMMQSSAHVRLELVMSKVRKEENPGQAGTDSLSSAVVNPHMA